MKTRFLVPFFLLPWLAGPAMAEGLSVPEDIAAKPARLWGEVMTAFYGPYDKKLKCWVAMHEGKRMCMRPHRLARSVEGGQERIHLAIGNVDVGGAGCHGCAGNVGFVVMGRNGDRFDTIAQGDLYHEMGSWGVPPPEEGFRLEKIGPDAYGWVVEMGYTGQGVTGMGSEIFAAEGVEVRSLGYVASFLDTCGAVPEGEPCTTIAYDLTFGPEGQGRYFDIAATASKDMTDTEIERRFVVPYDAAKRKYVAPEAMSSALGM